MTLLCGTLVGILGVNISLAKTDNTKTRNTVMPLTAHLRSCSLKKQAPEKKKKKRT